MLVEQKFYYEMNVAFLKAMDLYPHDGFCGYHALGKAIPADAEKNSFLLKDFNKKLEVFKSFEQVK